MNRIDITYPLRVGRKQGRVLVDARGIEILNVSPAFQELTHELCGYLNACYYDQIKINNEKQILNKKAEKGV